MPGAGPFTLFGANDSQRAGAIRADAASAVFDQLDALPTWSNGSAERVLAPVAAVGEAAGAARVVATGLQPCDTSEHNDERELVVLSIGDAERTLGAQSCGAVNHRAPAS